MLIGLTNKHQTATQPNSPRVATGAAATPLCVLWVLPDSTAEFYTAVGAGIMAKVCVLQVGHPPTLVKLYSFAHNVRGCGHDFDSNSARNSVTADG